MGRFLVTILLVCCASLSGCTRDKNSPRGFSLPEGDAARGKARFVELQCNACHSTPDVELLAADSADNISVSLGGEVTRVKTYADLVTSIINPSHRLAPGYPVEIVATGDKSRMRNYNDVMTVAQLIDLVSYLQPFYPLRVYIPTEYGGYYP